MNYREAYAYLNSFTNFEQVPGINYALEMDGLARVELLMQLLGRPHQSFRSVVIAGTKGKGSTAALMHAALTSAGYKTGLYTSPHLHSFRERIRIGDEMIPVADMVNLVERLTEQVDKIKQLDVPSLLPTTYELTTALAFMHFREQEIDIAVLEVGLGGRLDAVNVVRPLVSVITPISLDHMQVLGNTIAEIAGEKAGIIKRNGAVVSAPQPEDAMEVIERYAEVNRASLDVVTRNVYISTQHLPEDVSDEAGVPVYQAFTLAYGEKGTEGSGRLRVKLPLLGTHQQVNAAVALAALRELDRQGVKIQNSDIIRGFESVVWPGRLEVVRRDPIVIVDGAHNVESMVRLNQSVNDLFYRRKVIVVLGLSADKDIRGIVGELGTAGGNVLGPRVEKIIATRSRHPRSASESEVAKCAREHGFFVEERPSVPEALATAVSIARAGATGALDDPIVVVTGSLFVVAEAREYYGLAPSYEEEAN